MSIRQKKQSIIFSQIPNRVKGFDRTALLCHSYWKNASGLNIPFSLPVYRVMFGYKITIFGIGDKKYLSPLTSMCIKHCILRNFRRKKKTKNTGGVRPTTFALLEKMSHHYKPPSNPLATGRSNPVLAAATSFCSKYQIKPVIIPIERRRPNGV